MPDIMAKRYLVRGRVQGVGFRYFVQRQARALGVRGHTRNLDDGQVEVFAVGTAAQLGELEGYLWKGPPYSDVRGVEGQETAVLKYKDFQINR